MEGEFDVLYDGSTLLAGEVLCGFENVAVQQGHFEGVGHAKGLMHSPVVESHPGIETEYTIKAYEPVASEAFLTLFHLVCVCSFMA